MSASGEIPGLSFVRGAFCLALAILALIAWVAIDTRDIVVGQIETAPGSRRGASWIDVDGVTQVVDIAQDPRRSWEETISEFRERLEAEKRRHPPRER
jgi:NADH:ubiquinone oxidoreductase subunit D